MQTVILRRGKSTLQGTAGILEIEGQEFCKTLELPWLNNAPQVSCIPPGTYIANWTFSPRFKKYTYHLEGVPGRSGIRIHSGNFAGCKPAFKSHVLGCILLGMSFGTIDNQLAILSSRRAITKFQTTMGRQPFKLVILGG